MLSKLIVTILVAFVCGGWAQQAVPGPCMDIPAVPFFNSTAYLGKWYEIEASSHVEEIGAICIEANYSDFGNGSLAVYNFQIDRVTGVGYGIRGNVRPLDPSTTEGKLLVSFPIVNAYDGPYWVMDTDYTTYSIVWNCNPYGQNSFQTVWFLSRQKSPSTQVRDYVHDKMAELGITDKLGLLSTVQEGCPDSKE